MRVCRGLPLLFGALAISCARGENQDPLAQAWAPRAAKDPVVARLPGTTIHASEVRRRRQQRDGGPVLDDLILEDLLAAEARRQGLLSDPAVRDAAHRALVQRLLSEVFEKSLTPADIPDDLLKRAYRRNFWYFNRPEVREFEHLAAMLPSGQPPAREEKVRRLAQDILAAARAPGAPPLSQLRSRFLPRARKLGIELRYEKALGVRKRLEKPFADLLWETPEGKLGDRVVRSRYGWHVLRHLRKKPAISRSFEQVKDQVRKKLWPQFRASRFKAWLQELRAKHGAQVEKVAKTLFRPHRKREPRLGPR